MKHSNYLFIKSVASILEHYNLFTEDIRFWIGCQFALESSFCDSHLAKAFNNFSGMKTPLVRPSTALNRGLSGSTEIWAKYLDLQSCVYDYVLCITYHKPFCKDIESLYCYRLFISKFYCPEKDYIDKVNRIYLQFKSYQNE